MSVGLPDTFGAVAARPGVSPAFAWHGHLMYNHPRGKSALLALLSSFIGLDLTALEPSFIIRFLKDADLLTWSMTQAVLSMGWLLGLFVIAAWAFDYRPQILRNRLTLAHKLPIIRPRSPQEE